MGHTKKTSYLQDPYVHPYITILVDGAHTHKKVTTCLCSRLYNHPGRWGTHKKTSYLQLAYGHLYITILVDGAHTHRGGKNKLQLAYVHPYITILVDGAHTKKQVTYNLLMFTFI